MKRISRRADVDLRGRVRRVQTAPPQIVKVTLMCSLAGAGIDIDVPANRILNDEVYYAGRVWTWAGRKTESGRRIFTKRPTERPIRRFILWLIGKNGKDPRLEEKAKPFKYDAEHPRPMKSGQGSRCRAAKRAVNA